MEEVVARGVEIDLAVDLDFLKVLGSSTSFLGDDGVDCLNVFFRVLIFD